MGGLAGCPGHHLKPALLLCADEYAFMGTLIIREVVRELLGKGLSGAKVLLLAGSRWAGQGLGWPWEASEMTVGLKGDVHLQRCPQSLNHSLRGTTRCLQAPHHLGLGAQTSASTSCTAAMRSSPTGAVLHSATIAAASSTTPLSSPTGQCLDFYVPTSLPYYSVSATQVGPV